MTKLTVLFAAVLLILTGCSASVRPLYTGNADTDISPDMQARADALGLQLSSTSEPALARALAQAEAFCEMHKEKLLVEVVQKTRGEEKVPVVHMECD